MYGMFSSVDNLTITEDEIILIDDFKYLEDASRVFNLKFIILFYASIWTNFIKLNLSYIKIF